MIVEELSIPDVKIFRPNVYHDNRGRFFETFSEVKYQPFLGKSLQFVQDNVSVSGKDVLRGLHFQTPPFEQGKLVSVLQGSVLDVAVDLRMHSPHFGQHISVLLSAENSKQLWIPPGFAHGFLSLEENTVFLYKCTTYYSPDHEAALLWNDNLLNIDWDCDRPIVSDKDQKAMSFRDFESPFK
jgi:dTDP-4-dehydrorhamnose 3,5-epimerase